ncbi:MAG: IclR family transcriptional regulator [Pseudomonadota bacterium]|nr:IclR family transcriptional regulator [Pseudomonadota bacterium]
MERTVNAPAKASTKTRLSSVANSIRLIKTFSDDEYEIGISNLAKRLGLAKSTVHRLASTLIDAGMLEQNPENGRYRLGLALFELGSLVRRKMDVSSEAKPYLKMLREKTGETVHLAILDHASVLFINNLESEHAIRMSVNVGVRAPAHCTAVGKALLAFQPPEMVEEVLSHELAGRTPKTMSNASELRQDLATVRARGYALDDEELETGLRCIAAPIRDHSGAVVASTSIAGPAQRMTKKALLAVAPDLIAAADAISARLGYQPLRFATLQRRA